MSFEANVGQTDSQVQYLVRGGRQTLFLTASQAVLNVRAPLTGTPRAPRTRAELAAQNSHNASLHMVYRNSQAPSSIEALDPLPGKVNYFLGRDASKWHTDIATYGRIAYRNIYPKVDLVYYGNQGALEYDFVAQPGADVNAIQVQFQGAQAIHLSSEGDLILDTKAGTVRWKKPVVYQDDHGVRRPVAANYRVGKNFGVEFAVARYNHKLPLVIDPILVWSTYLGGNAADLVDAQNIFADSTGIYTAGITYSTNFPETDETILEGTYNVFVTKFNPQGSALIYSTYLGGSVEDGENAFVVGSDGSLYVTGFTDSYNFPVYNAVQPYLYGVENAFVSHLTPAGNQLYFSTFLGGSGSVDENGDSLGDDAYSIALDSSANVYISGSTASYDFPVTEGALQTSFGGGNYDAFITKLNPTGNAFVYSTYLGGSGDEQAQNPSIGSAPPKINFVYGNWIRVDSAGDAYIGGVTTSTNFPTTAGAYSRVNQGGGGDGFVSKVAPNGGSLIYSTLIGGNGFDAVCTINIDSSGNVLMAGVTGPNTTTGVNNFPTTPGAFQRVYGGGAEDGFAAHLDPTGSTLLYSTLFGGEDQEAYMGADVAPNGDVVLSGITYSNNIPVTPGTYQATYGGSGDIFISLFDGAITSLVDSTYFGTSGLDEGGARFGLSSTDLLVSGRTTSNAFPTTAGAYDRIYNGGDYDAILARFTASPACAYSISPTSASPSSAAGSGTISVGATAGCPWGAASNVSWLSVTAGSPASGTGSMSYSVQANPGGARTGAITVAGQTYTVTQAGAAQCTFSLSPVNASLPSLGGPTATSLTASAPTCGWTATSNSSWISLTSAASGTGSATVSMSVAANTTSSPITGSITVAGIQFDVTVAAPGSSTCSFSFLPLSASLPPTGTSTVETCPNSSGQPNCGVLPEAPASVLVTPGGNCGAWTAASSNPEFLQITSGANGSGSGAVGYTLLNNTHNGQQNYTITVSSAAGSAAYAVTEGGSGDSEVYRQVYALYEQLLGRDPDPGGFAFWTGTGGAGLGQMADSFLTSPEAFNSDFAVMATYQAATGAAPSFAQFTAAVARLRAGAQTVAGLFNSLTAAGYSSTNLYQNLLGRAPTGADSACINTGLSTCFQTIVGYPSSTTPVGAPSNEFQSTGIYHSVDHTNGLYATMIYFVTLSRDPDPSGLAFWTGVANSGGPGLLFQGSAGYATRIQILGPGTPNQGFIGSTEFQGLFAN
ncbi:MAG TPA: BACON domain-containing carbohydrate-binding protein [Bryobacteraceae bacterium]|nr:BACON domain-containing carbohydrate-binding protein [Bryobacteraceae bacterium]